jgi:hypothetical protein
LSRFPDATETNTYTTQDFYVRVISSHNKDKTRKSMTSARFEPAIPVIEKLQTYVLASTATEIFLDIRRSYVSSVVQAFSFPNRSAFTVKTNLCLLCQYSVPVTLSVPLQTILALQCVTAVIGNSLASQHLNDTTCWNIQVFPVFGHTFSNPNKSMVCFDCKFVYFYGLVYDVSTSEYIASSYRTINI